MTIKITVEGFIKPGTLIPIIGIMSRIPYNGEPVNPALIRALATIEKTAKRRENGSIRRKYKYRSDKPEPYQPPLNKISEYDFTGYQLGKGAFGLVMLAKHRVTGIDVAIKLQLVSIVPEEIEILQKLQGDCSDFLCVYEIIAIPGIQFIVMERIQGDTLGNLMNRGLINSNLEKKGIINGMSQIIHNLHRLGIAHKDIKPDNIMYNRDTGKLKIVDYNLSCTSSICNISGTPAYMHDFFTSRFNDGEMYNIELFMENDWYSLDVIAKMLGVNEGLIQRYTRLESLQGRFEDTDMLNEIERWVVDSGASCHVTGQGECLEYSVAPPSEILFANGTVGTCTTVGEGIVSVNGVPMKLSNVFKLKDAANLLSIPSLDKQGYRFEFENREVKITNRKIPDFLIIAKLNARNAYVVEIKNRNGTFDCNPTDIDELRSSINNLMRRSGRQYELRKANASKRRNAIFKK